jgi:plastocyanin
MNWRWLAASMLAAGLVLAGCAEQTDGEPVPTDQVDLPRSYHFAPDAISVPAGTTVTWTNNDQFSHNVRLAATGEVLSMAPGESVTHTFSEPGEFEYDCSLHPHDMQGVVIVTDS